MQFKIKLFRLEIKLPVKNNSKNCLKMMAPNNKIWEWEWKINVRHCAFGFATLKTNSLNKEK